MSVRAFLLSSFLALSVVVGMFFWAASADTALRLQEAAQSAPTGLPCDSLYRAIA